MFWQIVEEYNFLPGALFFPTVRYSIQKVFPVIIKEIKKETP